MRLLVGTTGYPFVVGDDDQCLAAGTPVTMGNRTRKPIEDVLPGEAVLSSYGAGDLRPAKVTDRFARHRRGQMICLHLATGRMVKSTPEHTHFAGYILGETPQTYFLYLMHKEGVGYRLGTSQVYTAGQARPTVGFKQRASAGTCGCRLDHPYAFQRERSQIGRNTDVTPLWAADIAIGGAQGQRNQRSGSRPKVHWQNLRFAEYD